MSPLNIQGICSSSTKYLERIRKNILYTLFTWQQPLLKFSTGHEKRRENLLYIMSYTFKVYHSAHWGINLPLSKTEHLSFMPSTPPLNLQTVQAPISQAIPPTYWFFVNPYKNLNLQWTFTILRFSILDPIPLFKNNFPSFDSYLWGCTLCVPL